MKLLSVMLVLLTILISGCVSTVNPVNPEDVTGNVAPIIIKEFQEKDLTVRISNNGSMSIDSVKVTSFEPFTVVSSGILNIPPKTKEAPTGVIIDIKIQAPSFKTDTKNSAMIISYASGKNEKGEPIIKTKAIPVETKILPDAKLQFVGFVKGPEHKSEAELTSWEIAKGQNATITFSVKNDGRTTIDKNTLTVLVDIENKEIGSNKTLTIGEGMARGGTSYTEALVLPVFKDSPNGETDVFVKLFMGDNLIDEKTIHLKVRLGK